MGNLEIEVKNASDEDVACALATLAGFPKGGRAGRCTNIWNDKINRHCAYVFHKDTMDKVGGDWAEAMACYGPDIIAIQIYEPSPMIWKPTDRYEVRFNEELVNPSLVDKCKIYETIIAEMKKTEMAVRKT